MPRIDDRHPDDLRAVRLTRSWAKNAEGSCLCEFGDTKVLCTATVENTVPAWKRGGGSGWLSAEYAMLPRSTGKRTPRPGLKTDGRSVEIQRLIGRSLRAAIDLEVLGEKTIILDCDVLQADGGTRCAAITGAWVALYEALAKLKTAGKIREIPLKGNVAAVSVGIIERAELLDLNYHEDSRAEVDMNVVMTDAGRLIEVQASGEGNTFSRAELGRLLELAKNGIDRLVALQNEAVKDL